MCHDREWVKISHPIAMRMLRKFLVRFLIVKVVVPSKQHVEHSEAQVSLVKLSFLEIFTHKLPSDPVKALDCVVI